MLSIFLNETFKILATIVKGVTGREVKFKKIHRTQSVEDAFANLNRFSGDISEALEYPMIKALGSFKPGKVYCLQVDFAGGDLDGYLDGLEEVIKFLAEMDIQIVVIGQDANFVVLPEGYKVVKKEAKDSL